MNRTTINIRMTAQQTAQAQEIFGEAMELEAPDRAGFVLTACGADEAVRREVETLLESIADAGAFLSTPASGRDTNLLIAASQIPSGVEQPGTRIGNYKLLQLIGEGGFGSVFMAEQEQPVRRKVALKIIKLGMDTKQVIARFEAERQALAMMDHPNIAQVFEAGATDTGRPYFVMELVRGVPITVYCDQNKLAPNQRLELFVDVCQAVQHAHQKGIIHRDLKPTNVLVTMHDDRPVPKVIDFGIAKATDARLTERTLFTEYHQFIGTPEYMSPEQAQFNGIDIDTRSDVYSLGVLLYELLTGTTPFESKELREAGYEQIAKLIREVDPPRPSTRLSTLKEGLPAVAAQRATDARRLSQLLRGELDWIVMKCLEKDRRRRYDAASALAADVKRHLADEPVLARPISNRYRLWKLFRRHKGAVLAVSVALLGLVGGLAAATYGLVRATHDRDDQIIARASEAKQRIAAEDANTVAQIERASAVRHETAARISAAQAQEVNRFLQEILAAPRPERALGKSVLVRDVLDEAAAKIDALGFNNRPEIEAAIRLTLGRSYQSLGEYRLAEGQLRKALAQAPRATGQDSELVAQVLADLAETVGRMGDYEGAVEMDRQVLAMQRRISGENSAAAADAMEDLARNLMHTDAPEEAKSRAQTALRIRQQLGERETVGIAFDRVLLSTFVEEPIEREKMLRAGLAIQRKLLDANHPDLANTLAGLGSILADQSKWEEAKKVLQESIAIKKRILPPGHPDFEPALTLLWQVLDQMQDWGAVRTALLDHYDWVTKNNPDDPAFNDMAALQRTCVLLGDASEVRKWHQQLQAGLAQKLLSLTSRINARPTDPEPLEERAMLEGRFRQFQQAADDFARAIEIDPQNHQNYYERGCLLAYLRDTTHYRDLCVAITKRFAESNDASILDRTAKTCLLLPGVAPLSESAAPLAVANRAVKLAGSKDDLTWINLCRGMALYRHGDYAVSVQSFETAMQPGNDVRRVTAQIFLAMAHQQMGQTERARSDLKSATQAMDSWLWAADEMDRVEGNLENWLMCKVARREAEELFTSSAK